MSGLLICLALNQDIKKKKDDQIFGFIGSSDYSKEHQFYFLAMRHFLRLLNETNEFYQNLM